MIIRPGLTPKVIYKHGICGRKHARTEHSDTVPPVQERMVADAAKQMFSDAPTAGPELTRAALVRW